MGRMLCSGGQWPSNWHPSVFVLEGETYCCVEQWMMAEKARQFGDAETVRLVMATSDPAEQKALGRAIRGYDDAKWAEVRYQQVLRGVVEKYRQNQDLRAWLLATGDLEFVEASAEDRVWGIGMRASDPASGDPKRWRGENLLGQATTEARRIIRAELGV